MVVKMTMLCKFISNFFKKEKSYIRFYSVAPGVVDLFPILPSASVKRKFLDAEIPIEFQGTLSSKNCPGIKKIISTGWIVPAPADFSIVTIGDGVSFEWNEPHRFTKITKDMDAYVSGHNRSQTEPLLDDPDTTLKTVVKLEMPWRIEASDDVVFLIIPVSYNNESRFVAATGILDPKYAHLLNIQLFWKQLNGTTVVKAGTPLCQLIPVSRKSLSISQYDVTIDNATIQDEQKEREFNYASTCTFLPKDTLASRLARTIKILNKYKKRG